MAAFPLMGGLLILVLILTISFSAPGIIMSIINLGIVKNVAVSLFLLILLSISFLIIPEVYSDWRARRQVFPYEG